MCEFLLLYLRATFKTTCYHGNNCDPAVKPIDGLLYIATAQQSEGNVPHSITLTEVYENVAKLVDTGKVTDRTSTFSEQSRIYTECFVSQYNFSGLLVEPGLKCSFMLHFEKLQRCARLSSYKLSNPHHSVEVTPGVCLQVILTGDYSF
jgi:hypothetical protein